MTADGGRVEARGGLSRPWAAIGRARAPRIVFAALGGWGLDGLSSGVGVDHRQRGHVDDAPHRRRRGQDVHRLGHPEQHRPDRNVVAGGGLQQVVAMLAESMFGQTSRLASPLACVSASARAASRRRPRVGMHLAVDLELVAPAACSSASAARIFSADGCCWSRSCGATARPPSARCRSRRSSSAASTVISAICSAVGS